MITLVFGLVVLVIGFISLCTVSYEDLAYPVMLLIMGIGLSISGLLIYLFT